MSNQSHIDGGAYRVLAFAETRDGWGVAVTEWTTYRNKVVFQVHRVSDKNVMLAQGTSEAAARQAANRLFAKDKGVSS